MKVGEVTGALPPPPPLPRQLLNLIGEYGMARTDGVCEIERLHRWDELIGGIKGYARDYANALVKNRGEAA